MLARWRKAKFIKKAISQESSVFLNLIRLFACELVVLDHFLTRYQPVPWGALFTLGLKTKYTLKCLNLPSRLVAEASVVFVRIRGKNALTLESEFCILDKF